MRVRSMIERVPAGELATGRRPRLDVYKRLRGFGWDVSAIAVARGRDTDVVFLACRVVDEPADAP